MRVVEERLGAMVEQYDLRLCLGSSRCYGRIQHDRAPHERVREVCLVRVRLTITLGDTPDVNRACQHVAYRLPALGLHYRSRRRLLRARSISRSASRRAMLSRLS